uniref:cytochrome P450 4V2-like n=1 Tax=Styela clava TaxID=7725 RepID=UPI0019396733|nr:cytochrome P450 4V2-like [Styela clava]
MGVAVYAVYLLVAYISFQIFLVLKTFAKNWITFKDVPGPPHRPLPLVGHLLRERVGVEEFYTRITTGLNEMAISSEREVACVFLGPIPVLFICGPNAAEVILRSSKHNEKGFMYHFLTEWLGTGLLTSKGDKWKERRRLLTPTFHFSILQDFLEVMNEQSSVFTRNLEKFAETGERLDIFNPVTLCALDIICETAMGKKINAQDNSESDYVTALYTISEMLFNRIRSPWLWPDFTFSLTSSGKRYYKCLNTLHGFTKSVIKDRMQNFNLDEDATSDVKKRPAFLDLLLRVSDNGKVLSFEDIQEEVDTFMFEGHDTTAAAMSWAIFLIGSHPEVQVRIQEELDEVLGQDMNRNITMDDLRKLDYLELVVKECLRVIPSVPLIGRVTSCECEIDGHKIPEGSECLLFPQLVNNFPKFWPDAESFNPERFTVENSVGRHPYAYLPFSAGPRNCIGQRFAMMEEKVMLAHLFRKFSVEACDKREDIKLLGDLILRPGDGINVKLKKRFE